MVPHYSGTMMAHLGDHTDPLSWTIETHYLGTMMTHYRARRHAARFHLQGTMETHHPVGTIAQGP
jgi:hypothetical protein